MKAASGGKIRELHIISHSAVYGGYELSREDVMLFKRYLEEKGKLVFHGCEVAEDPKALSLARELKQAKQIDVFAHPRGGEAGRPWGFLLLGGRRPTRVAAARVISLSYIFRWMARRSPVKLAEAAASAAKTDPAVAHFAAVMLLGKLHQLSATTITESGKKQWHYAWQMSKRWSKQLQAFRTAIQVEWAEMHAKQK